MQFTLKKINISYKHILPLIHILLSFIYERFIFYFHDNYNALLTLRTESIVSFNAEKVIIYILTKLISVLIIWGVWKLIFLIYERRMPRKVFAPVLVLFVFLLIVLLISYPDSFGLEMDNYENYIMVKRFIPTYWQHILTGIYYGACMMVIPHPISVQLLQLVGVTCVIGYIFYCITERCDCAKAYYLFLILLMPETYYLVINPYRGDLYSVIVIFYIAYMFFEIYEYHDVITYKRIIFGSFITMIVMSWRSEGKLIGLVGCAIFIISFFRIHVGAKKILVFLISTFLMVVTISKVQEIGSTKYYGNDYMIINTIEVLRNIFNNENANLSYDGVEENLEAIDSVIPVEVIKEQGQSGFRNYNWTKGHLDYNQTLVSDEQSDAYMKSYYNIVVHNIDDYLNVQLNCLYRSLQIDPTWDEFWYEDEPTVQLEKFQYTQWVDGRNELYSDGMTERIAESNKRQFANTILNKVITAWRDIMNSSGINVIKNIGLIVSVLAMLFYEMFNIRENKEALFFVLMSLALLGQLAGIILFMPEGRPQYLYPTISGAFCLLYIRILIWDK